MEARDPENNAVNDRPVGCRKATPTKAVSLFALNWPKDSGSYQRWDRYVHEPASNGEVERPAQKRLIAAAAGATLSNGARGA